MVNENEKEKRRRMRNEGMDGGLWIGMLEVGKVKWIGGRSNKKIALRLRFGCLERST